MNPRLAMRLVRLGYAGAAGAGIGSFAFWTIYWFSFVRGSLRGPDFFNFYGAAKLYVTSGGSAVYDLAMQRQIELQITGQDPSRFILLPYFHPPYYTLLIAPLAFLDYRHAYYVMAAVNVALVVALIAILVKTGLRVHGRGWLVASAMIGGFFPLFVTVLQGQSDLVVLVPLAGAYASWARGRYAMAGALSALALAKPQLLLLIPILFIARRAWGALAAFAAVVLALGVVSVVGLGFGSVMTYLTTVGSWAVTGQIPTTGLVYTDPAVYSFRALLEGIPGAGQVVAPAILLLLLALAALSLSWRPDRPRLDFALAIAVSLVLSPHQNIHDLALLVIPGFALADLALAGQLRWPHVAVAVLFFAYAAIDLTLTINFWSAAIGAFAVAGYLVVERMAVRPDPIPLGELQWSGPRPRRAASPAGYAGTLGNNPRTLGGRRLGTDRDALAGQRELDVLARLVDPPLDRGEGDLE